MARYVVSVQSPKPQQEAFDYMADLSNFAQWDPGVESVEQVEGKGQGPATAIDVAVRTAGRTIVLRYHVTLYEPPGKIVARAESGTLVSLDTMTIDATDSGAVVTYDAELTLKGALRVFEPVLGVAFKRIGDTAAAGLVRVLEGEHIDRPPG
jgi:carbon monoxide dehydrogenase subunit G